MKNINCLIHVAFQFGKISFAVVIDKKMRKTATFGTIAI